MSERQYSARAGIIMWVCSSPGQTFGGPYMPTYVPPDIKWYKRHELMTAINLIKYKHFAEDPQK